MPLLLVIGGLLVSGLFGAASVLDKIDAIQDNSSGGSGGQLNLINMGSLALLTIGGVALWQALKK